MAPRCQRQSTMECSGCPCYHESILDERAVIVGGGPCGLVCARPLSDLGHERFVVTDAAAIAGILVASTTGPAKFISAALMNSYDDTGSRRG